MTGKLPSSALELVQWHEARRDGQLVGREGLLIEHVKHPYHIDIDSKNNWQLWHFDNADKPKVVARGSSNDDEAAMAEATAAAVAKIPSLRDYAKSTLSAPTGGHVSPAGVTNLRSTFRVYLAGTAAVLGSLFGVYWFIRTRPVIATLALMLLAFGLYVTHQILAFAERVNGRREKLLKQQQAHAVIAQSKQKPLPNQVLMRRP